MLQLSWYNLNNVEWDIKHQTINMIKTVLSIINWFPFPECLLLLGPRLIRKLRKRFKYHLQNQSQEVGLPRSQVTQNHLRYRTLSMSVYLRDSGWSAKVMGRWQTSLLMKVQCFKGMDTSGVATPSKQFLPPSENGAFSKMKEFAPCRSKFLTFRVGPFSEGAWYARKQNGSDRSCFPCKNKLEKKATKCIGSL